MNLGGIVDMNQESKLLTLEKVKLVVASTLKIPGEKLDVDAEFDTFGIDSIVAMELMKNLSAEFNVSITPAQFTEVNTVRELTLTIEPSVTEEKIVAPKERTIIKPKPEKKTNKILRTGKNYNRHTTNPKKRDRDTSVSKIVDFIEAKYGISLTGTKFRNVEEIVELLATKHFSQLVDYYDSYSGTISDNDSIEREDGKIPKESSIKRSLSDSLDIAIVGLSCNFPDAENIAIFWNNLITEKRSIKEIPENRWSWKLHYSDKEEPEKTISKWGAFVKNYDCFDADFFNFSEEKAKLLDPQERLLTQEVYTAFEDACIDISSLNGSNTGVFVGYEYAEYENYLRNNLSKIENPPVFSSSSPTYYLANRISYIFGFCGASESININCASSAAAINRACLSLTNRETDIVVAAGVSLNLFEQDYIAASQYGMLSPDGSCAVFGEEANGFTRGEGVGAVVLQPLADAQEENRRIYGVIKSCHQNNRGKANDISEVKHESITEVIQETYNKSSIPIESLRYIEVDGYCTKWGDSFEFEGIKNAFSHVTGEGKYCALGSLKGNIGHLEPASGIASFIKIALSLYHREFPATITAKAISSFIDIDNNDHPLYIADKSSSFEEIQGKFEGPIRAGINSFSDSGANVHIVVEEYQSTVQEHQAERSQIFVISAKNKENLFEHINNFINFLPNNEIPFRDINYSLQVGREALKERLAIVCDSKQELLDKLILMKNKFKHDFVELEKKGIFYKNLNDVNGNTLNRVTTKEMLGQLVEQNFLAENWLEIALLWTNGADIPWQRIWKSHPAKPVSLPCYPFSKKRYWVSVESLMETENSSEENDINNFSDKEKKEEKKETEQKWQFSKSDDSIEAPISMNAIDKIELFLKQEVAEQLKKNIQQIDINKNFLELGVNSLGITGLIQKTNKILNSRLSPSVVFKYPDISSFTHYLVESYQSNIDGIFIGKNISLFDSLESNKPVKSEDKILTTETLTSDSKTDELEVLEALSLQDTSEVSDYEKITF